MADTQEQLLNPALALGPTDLVRTVSNPITSPDSTVMEKSNFVDSLFADAVSTSISVNTNNLTATGLATSHVLRLSSTGAVNVTGLQTGVPGRIIVIHNVGASIITFIDESALSDPTNRFALTKDLPVAPDMMIILQYDGTTQRWRIAGGSGGGGHNIQDEGTPLASRANLNFIGAGIGAADNPGADATDVIVTINEATLSLSDLTLNDVSTTKHGLMSKLPGSVSKSYRGNGTWANAPQGDGWAQFTDAAFSQLSTTAFQVSGDHTAVFRKGARVAFVDSGGLKYGVVLSVVFSSPNTQVTLFTNSDYSVAAGMSSLYFSYDPLPNGFPSSFNYAPAAISGITIGNGTLTGKFFVIGSQVLGDWTLTRGSTTTFGAQIYVGFPCSSNQNGYFVVGNCSLVDQGVALYTGIQINDNTVRCMNASGTYAVYAYVSSTVPFTWAAGDFIETSFRYRF